jgi:hypothetical protein
VSRRDEVLDILRASWEAVTDSGDGMLHNVTCCGCGVLIKDDQRAIRFGLDEGPSYSVCDEICAKVLHDELVMADDDDEGRELDAFDAL